jgi:hypothetical protein
MSLRFGKPTDWHKATPGMTDAGGRFALTGGKAPAPRIIAMSEDGRLFTLVSNVDAGREIPVALPEPATLVLHYDIPDDDLAAHAYLNWESAGSDPEGRHYVNIGFDAEVSNQTELVMTNLTPGSWRLSWRKSLDLVVGGGSGMGMPTSRSFLLENSTTVLEPGRTNRVDWVRPAGQSVRGEVTGIAEAEAPGAFVYAFSAHSTNSPAARVMGEVPLDGVTCGKDGQFHTARLAPGDYLIVALAYDYKQKSPSVLYNRGKGAELFGSVRVTITTNEAPPPVRIELTPAGGSGN